MSENDERKRIFNNLVGSEAFKELEKWVNDESIATQNRMDAISAKDINLNIVLENKGLRMGMRKVIKKAYDEAEI